LIYPTKIIQVHENEKELCHIEFPISNIDPYLSVYNALLFDQKATRINQGGIMQG